MPSSFQNKCLPVTINSYKWGTENRKPEAGRLPALPRVACTEPFIQAVAALRLLSLYQDSCYRRSLSQLRGCFKRNRERLVLRGYRAVATREQPLGANRSQEIGTSRYSGKTLSRTAGAQSPRHPSFFLPLNCHTVRKPASALPTCIIHSQFVTRSWQSHKS